MTLRAALHSMMSGPDPEALATLDALGFDNLPADDLASALVHFAERCPLDLADLISPIATRLSAVPFVEGDLAAAPGVDSILAEGGDVYDLLGELERSMSPADAVDPVELDLGEEPVPAAEEDTDFGFGQGDDSPTEIDELDFDEVASMTEYDDGYIEAPADLEQDMVDELAEIAPLSIEEDQSDEPDVDFDLE